MISTSGGARIYVQAFHLYVASVYSAFAVAITFVNMLI